VNNPSYVKRIYYGSQSQAQMAFVGDRSAIWHGPGTQVAPDLTPVQMMEAAGLNWEVEKTPLFTNLNGDTIRINNRYALTRTSDGQVIWAMAKINESIEVVKGDVMTQYDFYLLHYHSIHSAYRTLEEAKNARDKLCNVRNQVDLKNVQIYGQNFNEYFNMLNRIM